MAQSCRARAVQLLLRFFFLHTLCTSCTYLSSQGLLLRLTHAMMRQFPPPRQYSLSKPPNGCYYSRTREEKGEMWGYIHTFKSTPSLHEVCEDGSWLLVFYSREGSARVIQDKKKRNETKNSLDQPAPARSTTARPPLPRAFLSAGRREGYRDFTPTHLTPTGVSVRAPGREMRRS